MTTNISDKDQIDITIQCAAATGRIRKGTEEMYMDLEEKHKNTQQEIHEINVDQEKREKNMTELDTEWCGCCISLFGGTQKSQKWKDDTDSQKEETVTTQPLPANSAGWRGQAQGAFIKSELENEMETNLQ